MLQFSTYLPKLDTKWCNNRLLKMSMWWSSQGRACRPMMIVDVMLHSSSDDLVLKRCLCVPSKVGVMPRRAWTIWSLIRRDTQERDREDNGLFHSGDTSTIPMIQYTYLGSACYAVWHYLYQLALRWYKVQSFMMCRNHLPQTILIVSLLMPTAPLFFSARQTSGNLS